MPIQMTNRNVHRLDKLVSKAVRTAEQHGAHRYVEQLHQKYPAVCRRLEKMTDREADNELDRLEHQMDNELNNLASSIYGSSLGEHMGQSQMLATAKTMAMMQNTVTLGTGLGQNMAGLGQNMYNTPNTQIMQNMQNASSPAEKAFVPDFGVLYTHSEELPADWAGAKITSYRRICTGNKWQVIFSSKWDKTLTIELFLDLEELNGKEVNEMANTFMEALNQRRVG